MKKLFGSLILVLLIIASISIYRTLSLHSQSIDRQNIVLPKIDAAGAAERLSAALRFQTISDQDSSQFTSFHQYLEQTYPSFHSATKKEPVETLSLLYCWNGTNKNLKPILMMSHQDVVPVEPGTEKLWKAPPFSGSVIDGVIYGRGAVDDKGGMIGILEATDLLIREKYIPQRTVYFAFGHDEETGGRGASATATWFKSRGIQFESVFDEGMVILDSTFAGVKKAKALIGIAEKGYLTIELSAVTEGGHSSMPPQNTAVGLLSAAIVKLETNQMSPRLEGAGLKMLQSLTPEMPFGNRLMFANLWLFRPLIMTTMKQSPGSNALIRTTTAPTMLKGSPKENVLATEASATVNFRILPGDSIESVMQHVRNVIDDSRIKIKKANAVEPSPVSNSSSAAYKTLAGTITSVFPQSIPVPALVLGGTDARYFSELSDNVYRFLPVQLKQDELSMVHGTNERIRIDAYTKAIQFYYAYLKEASK